MVASTDGQEAQVYVQERDVEDLEDYAVGGFHPTIIGDTFHDGRYVVVHKLGYGGYSTIWLARDQQLERFVSLKILVASKSARSTEGQILELLQQGDPCHPGRRFIPRLLHQFFFDGPNGRHLCLVGEPAGCCLSESKEDCEDYMFPVDAARSIAAQLVLGLSYLHVCGICHGDLHQGNFLLRCPNLDSLTVEQLYERYGRPESVPITRIDKTPVGPHAPPHAIYPIRFEMPADRVTDPEIIIADYGASFVVATKKSPILHTPALYLPPEDFFNGPITPAADIWTLGVTLYEIIGARPLFETRCQDRDDIIADMINALGRPPERWWDAWEKRSEFFKPDGSWVPEYNRAAAPIFRRLHQRMWEMGRGEFPWTCVWDVNGGELTALEEMLKRMMAYEPDQRPTAEELVESEYLKRWALPAWEKQLRSRSEHCVQVVCS